MRNEITTVSYPVSIITLFFLVACGVNCATMCFTRRRQQEGGARFWVGQYRRHSKVRRGEIWMIDWTIDWMVGWLCCTGRRFFVLRFVLTVSSSRLVGSLSVLFLALLTSPSCSASRVYFSICLFFCYLLFLSPDMKDMKLDEMGLMLAKRESKIKRKHAFYYFYLCCASDLVYTLISLDGSYPGYCGELIGLIILVWSSTVSPLPYTA